MPCSHHSLLRVPALIVLLALSFGRAVPSVAQTAEQKENKHQEKPYALIFGTVWGPDNRPVFGVKVRCRRANEKKTRWEAYSDHSGEFAFRVPAGKAEYAVGADLKGFKSLDGKHFQAPPEVTVPIENDERTDIGVHLK